MLVHYTQLTHSLAVKIYLLQCSQYWNVELAVAVELVVVEAAAVVAAAVAAVAVMVPVPMVMVARDRIVMFVVGLSALGDLPMAVCLAILLCYHQNSRP